MNETTQNSAIKVVGKSWVIDLPNDFAGENNLENGTKVLLTFKGENVNAEILPPLSDKLSEIADKILKKRKKVFEELKSLGD
jgi:antitoxin component of MazEF toxin-antitoxin module